MKTCWLLATDYSLETDRTLLDINHIEQIAEFIYQWWKRRSNRTSAL